MIVSSYEHNDLGHGFVDVVGRFTPIKDPNAGTARNESTIPWSVNDSGVIVGR